MTEISQQFLPEAAETQLRESLKRCNPKVIEAAVEYRKTNNPKDISMIILGIIERFLEPESRPRLAEPNNEQLSLIDDLGIDSLVMVEIVITLEESLNLSISNEELQEIRTIKDVQDKIRDLTSATA